MSFYKLLTVVILIIAVAGLVLAIVALNKAKEAKQLAISEVQIEETGSLITPVLDQEKNNAWSYLALYEIQISNLGGPSVTLENIAKHDEETGFLVLLKDQQVLLDTIEYRSIVCDRSLAEIRANPGVLKNLFNSDMGGSANVNLIIDPGESKTLRFGVRAFPYNEENKPIADMLLLSYRLRFDTGKHYIFRRAFPIRPVPGN